MTNSKRQQPLDTSAFQRMRKWYLFALAAIAIAIIVAQILIQLHLNSQLDDSRVINVAGRQRAYSQKLVKEALLLKTANSEGEKKIIVSEIDNTLRIWKESHDGLQYGNMPQGLPIEDDKEIVELFKQITPHHNAMVAAVESIVKDGLSETYEENITVLLQNERTFLELMDNIVNEYDERSKEQLQKLKFKEYLLLAISLGILLLEMFFIFRPLSIHIRNTIKDLLKSRQRSDQNANEIKRLYAEKEKSLEELKELNFVIDNAALFASAKNDGSIVFISKKFKELLGLTNSDLSLPLAEALTVEEGERQYLREVLRARRKHIRNEEINVKTKTGENLWLDMSIVPMHMSSMQQSILILCSDITQRKITQLKIEQLSKEKYEESLRQKQEQAGQIVEGQEEERKRIAKDIHDGIGQMLTALKFNIESINLDQKDKTVEKIAYIKQLTSDLIKGVRTATFNLTPPELSDHGIFPALQKMTSELAKLTGKNILFENKAKENIRFDSLAETNIYRVSQEAINNAIKYADSNYILLTINYSDNILSIVVDDDGKGFDDSILNQLPTNTSEGGMGLFFMKERMGYINGRLFINSEPGKGTRVTINYQTKNAKVLHGTE
ncbi:PAS domain S-box-containing protein [Saonia flava]|uniref:histidine kinase n=1 Tax=Saonia flava TaxID=523696 RepID=A0A846R7T3_9FLAO|nr:ATP-binding protein [Saonia flava]NJB72819.1 PAS domain S-box-containing protein [Saonia flava]